jgi:hypothetical protein
MQQVATMLGNLSTGVLYKNPKSHVRSIHAYFPSVAERVGGELVAAYVLGEAFEATNLRTNVARSADGRWLLPTSTWMDWEGRLPNGNRMLAFVSADRGETWPQYIDVMHSPTDRLIYWESKILQLSDGRRRSRPVCWVKPSRLASFRATESSASTAAWTSLASGPTSPVWKASAGSTTPASLFGAIAAPRGRPR